MNSKVICSDVLDGLRQLSDESIQCVVTSPPYFRLKNYRADGQLGLERTPEDYVQKMVNIFREVSRVLRHDGTVWLNLGDSYLAKRLTGIPWRVALALQASGWWLRSDIIWHRPNQKPSSVKDRPTTDHEYLFLLSKSSRYYYDHDAIREPHASAFSKDAIQKAGGIVGGIRPVGCNFSKEERRSNGAKTPRTRAERAALLNPLGRNKRTVWSINTFPYKGAHFATFPEDLVKPCILAGSKTGDVVLDPFLGTGTTSLVAVKNGRNAIGIEIRPEYCEIAKKRIDRIVSNCS